MAFQLPDLPYAHDALEPFMSADTLQTHHGKHHQAYVDKLNAALGDDDDRSLEAVIQNAVGREGAHGVFNNAAQVWNHTFFWNCMTPQGGGRPDGALAEQIDADFGGFNAFRDAFKAAAMAQFGSGWAWLVLENGTLKITTTSNADLPMVHGQHALLTCDVWEHAYYLDHKNRRDAFLDAFLDKLVNWAFVAEQFERYSGTNAAEQAA